MWCKNNPVAPHDWAVFKLFSLLHASQVQEWPSCASGKTEKKKKRKKTHHQIPSTVITRTGPCSVSERTNKMILEAATPPWWISVELKDTVQRLSSPALAPCHSFLSRIGWTPAKVMSRLLPGKKTYGSILSKPSPSFYTVIVRKIM